MSAAAADGWRAWVERDMGRPSNDYSGRRRCVQSIRTCRGARYDAAACPPSVAALSPSTESADEHFRQHRRHDDVRALRHRGHAARSDRRSRSPICTAVIRACCRSSRRRSTSRRSGDAVSVDVEPADAFRRLRPGARQARARRATCHPKSRSACNSRPSPKPDDEPGSGIVFTVTDIADGKAVLDGNHPWAGKRLRFECRILDVRAATAGGSGARPCAWRARPSSLTAPDMAQILFKNADLLDPRADALQGGVSVLVEGETHPRGFREGDQGGEGRRDRLQGPDADARPHRLPRSRDAVGGEYPPARVHSADDDDRARRRAWCAR